jgi:hypothetical protein
MGWTPVLGLLRTSGGLREVVRVVAVAKDGGLRPAPAGERGAVGVRGESSLQAWLSADGDSATSARQLSRLIRSH